MLRSMSADRVLLNMHAAHRGYAYVIAAAVLWAVSGTTAKYLFNAGVSPFQLVQLRLTIASITLLAWLAIRHPTLLPISRGDIWYFGLYGLLGMAACQFTYLFAISKIQVAPAILLQYLAPCFITAHAVVFARERLRLSTALALGGATLGCYLVVGAYNLELLRLNWLGVLSGTASAVLFAWCSIHGEYGMRQYNPWTVLLFGLLFGALIWLIAYPPLRVVQLGCDLTTWALIVYIGVFGTLLPFGFYLQGINYIRSTRASITATLEPIAAGVIAYFFLGETMAPLQIAGGILVIGCIILLRLKHESDSRAPEIMRNHPTAGRRLAD